jgi:hypothetical protein
MPGKILHPVLVLMEKNLSVSVQDIRMIQTEIRAGIPANCDGISLYERRVGPYWITTGICTFPTDTFSAVLDSAGGVGISYSFVSRGCNSGGICVFL